MRYKKILNHTKESSTLCLGTMIFGTQNTQQDSFAFMDYAYKHGINCFDTAELYPVPAIKLDTLHLSENIIGDWIQQSGVNRDTLTLVSKVMGPVGERSQSARPQQDPLSPKTIRSAIMGTLQRLKTEYLDIYLVHWPIRNSNFFGKLEYTPQEESFDVEAQILSVIQSMDSLIQQGKILHYGLSNETAWGIMKYIQLAEKHNLAKPVTVQNPYSLLNRSYELGCAEISHREGIGLMSYAVTASGALTGKHMNGPAKNSRLALWPKYFGRYEKQQGKKAIKAYVDLAHDIGMSPATLAIAFALQKPFMDCAIIGCSKMFQLQQWIDAWDITLGEDILNRIEEIHNIYTYPCP